MDWLIKYLSSSIGRKQLMAITGLNLCGFLAMHLLGNFTLFLGYEDGQCAFNDYAKMLTSNKMLLYPAEVVLFSLFAIHIYLGFILTIENKEARKVRYFVDAKAGDMTLASKTMWFTGGWTFFFLIIHLINFKFADHSIPKGLYGVVENHFDNPFWSLYYVVSMVLLGLHVSHGLQSSLKTLGFNHKKYRPIVQNISLGFAAFITIGFSSLPIWFLLT